MSDVAGNLEAVRSGPLADLRDPARILEGATVFDGKVFDVNRETVAFHGGTMVREYTVHHGAVAVLALDDDDNVLLINQYRQPIRSREWEIPAGLLDIEGEDALTAAQRELAEETDLIAADWSEPISMATSPGQSDEIVHLFFARGLSPAPHPHERTDEEAEIVVRWAPLDEVVAGVLEGRLHNAILMIGVLGAVARRG